MKIGNIRKYLQLYNAEHYLFSVIGVRARKRGFLSFDEFYRICIWKSNRPKNRYLRNQKIVEDITKKAFREKDEKKKIIILCKLDGVYIPTASAILTVVFPEKYAIIDIRCVEMLEKFNYKISRSISVNNWLKYLDIIRSIAKENRVTPREMDMVFFAMHREILEQENYRNLYK